MFSKTASFILYKHIITTRGDVSGSYHKFFITCFEEKKHSLFLGGMGGWGVVHNCTIFLCSLDVRNIVQGGDPLYGSISAGREKWPFNVIFFLKVEPPCDQT